jgi:hypothetical protein
MALTQISTAGVKDDAVTSGKIPANAVGSSELADNAVTLAKLEHGTSSNDGKFLRANNGADPTFESVITDLVNDTSPQLGGNLASNGNRVVMADDDQITLGTGNDLTLFHESSSNFNVIRQNNALSTKWLAGSDTVARFMTNGAVELYHDNSKKFETVSYGAAVSGILTSTGDIKTMNDTAKFVSGASDDLQIYHNGSNSYVQDVGTGNLHLTSNGTAVSIDKGTSENMAVFNTDGAVELYYDNSKKFETYANGIYSHGNLNFTSDSSKIFMGSGDDLRIYHDGTNSYIQNITGALRVYNHVLDVRNDVGNETILKGSANGSVELYYDSSKKFETTSNGINVLGNLGIGDTSADFEIEVNSASPMIRLEETSTGGSKRLDLGVTSSGNPYIGANQSSQSIQIETSGYRRFTFGTSEMYTANDGTDFSWGSNPGHVVYQTGEYRSTSANGTHIRCNRMNGDGHVAQWYRGSSNMVGFISISSSGTSYGSGSSDVNTKKNIEAWSENVLSKFKSLTPKLFNFNWEADDTPKHKGYIAQNEVNKFPEAYPKNSLTDCDNEFYTFTPTDMTVYLMKGLKEAAERIETLEAKVAVLEAA